MPSQAEARAWWAEDEEPYAPPAPAPRPRRTVTITGQASVPHLVDVSDPHAAPRRSYDRSTRRPRSVDQRIGPRPDRVAMWSMLMGVALVIVALAS